MSRYRVLSLFSGIGGTEIGLKGGFRFLDKEYDRLPTDLVFANDIDTGARELFDANFSIKSNGTDIRKLNIFDLPDADIVTGGFPCQSFSVSATNPPRLGIKDDRGQLFFDMNRVLQIKHPKVFIAENVKGIFSANDGKAFPLIIKTFEESGYNVSYHLFHSEQYGVPQKRQRVFIVGFRKDLDVKFSFPEPIIKEESSYVPIKKILETNVNEKYFFSKRAVEGLKKSKNSKAMNKGRAQNINRPSNTVGAHLAKVSLNSTDPVLLDNGRYRRFTPREVARIQSFPEDYKLVGSQTQQYRGLGNAIPPVLMWYIARNVVKALNNATYRQRAVTQISLF